MRKDMIRVGLWSEDDHRDPSESIEAAWTVVERMRERGWGLVVCDMRLHHGGGTSDYDVEFDNLTMQRTASSPSLPLAICRAALAAVRGDDGEGRAS